MRLDNTEEFERILHNIRRPARYIGGEWNQVVKDDHHGVRIALAYPDVYEIGMSNLGLRLLYEIVNSRADYAAERVFSPWVDMEEQMRRKSIPLSSLETLTPIKDFDVFGFSLQHELSFSNVLNMIDLAGLALRSNERAEDDPLVIAGGPSVFNPEPMSSFIDAFAVGDGEEVILEILEAVESRRRSSGISRSELLKMLSEIEGVYVPGVHSNGQGYPLMAPDGVELKIKKRVVTDFDQTSSLETPVVPFLETIHDRCVVEVMRGCTRGCRFCQAGVIYRPTRERAAEKVADAVATQVENTGYDEVSLASLSTTDHSQIERALEAVDGLSSRPLVMSLPSLRTDQFSVEIAERVAAVKKTGLTFAPEAGTARLRRIINKGLTEDDLLLTAAKAFQAGWTRLKLYFMICLPTETDDDILGIAELANKVLEVAKKELGKGRSRRVKITVSISSFVPKPHTPFQWFSFPGSAEVDRRQMLLIDRLHSRQIKLKWHDAGTSLLEAAMARGGRELVDVIEAAFRGGARFDSWNDEFSLDIWQNAFERCGLDIAKEAGKVWKLDEPLPWDHIDSRVDKDWLAVEYEKALCEEHTEDCRTGRCSKCGVCSGSVRMEIKNGCVVSTKEA